jgi:hypothetical protein
VLIVRIVAGVAPAMFEQLDFVYLPSHDVAAEVDMFIAGLGAELVFAIEAFDTRVAMLRLTDQAPALLLAGHLEDDRPVLVHRVMDLERELGEPAQRGVGVRARFEIPPGPGAELETPGPQRIALYQATRPETLDRLAGRSDF